MAPSKKAPAAAKENVSLGPLAGDGMFNNLRESGQVLTMNRQARFRRCPHLRLLQRYLRSRYRSLVSNPRIKIFSIEPAKKVGRARQSNMQKEQRTDNSWLTAVAKPSAVSPVV
jgi:hypothetical protein